MRTRFRVEVAPTTTVELELIEVECADAGATSKPNVLPYEHFSLIFAGAAEDRLPQRTYRFQHEKLGRFEVFIVPIAAEGERIRYQAVFNRLLAQTSAPES